MTLWNPKIILFSFFTLSSCFLRASENNSLKMGQHKVKTAIKVLNSSLSDEEKLTLLTGLGVAVTGEGVVVGATGVGVGLSLSAIKKWKKSHSSKRRKPLRNKKILPLEANGETPPPVPPREEETLSTPSPSQNSASSRESAPPLPYREPEEASQSRHEDFVSKEPVPLPSDLGNSLSKEALEKGRGNLRKTPSNSHKGTLPKEGETFFNHPKAQAMQNLWKLNNPESDGNDQNSQEDDEWKVEEEGEEPPRKKDSESHMSEDKTMTNPVINLSHPLPSPPPLETSFPSSSQTGETRSQTKVPSPTPSLHLSDHSHASSSESASKSRVRTMVDRFEKQH